MSEADQIAGAARAMQLILHERARQIDVEGYSTDHDDGHRQGEIAMAAAAYAISGVPAFGTQSLKVASCWPVGWGQEPRHQDPKRALVKAGAMILAELERLDREERRSVTVT